MSVTTRVGVIGVGAMGRHHVRVYSGLPGVQLVGVAEVDEKLGSKIAEEYSTKVYSNYKELLRKGLDAVSIVVPTFLHREVAIEAIDAGINVLIEKPIADTVKGAEEIINRAEQKNVKLMVGHIERFNPSVQAMKKSLEGLKIISIEVVRIGPIPLRIKDVGVVVDLAIHDIDVIRYLTASEFRKIYGLTSNNLSKNEDVAILLFEMENGTLAHITANWLTPFKVREITASTNEKFVKCWLIEQRVVEYGKFEYEENSSYVVKELNVRYAEPLRLELEAFVTCLRENSAPAVTGEDGLKALKVADAILHLGRA